MIARLPADWDEEYHEASKLTVRATAEPTADAEPEPLPFAHLAGMLGELDTPLHLVVVAGRVSGLAFGSYDYDHVTRALRPRPGPAVPRFYAGVHPGAAAPAASIAVVADLAAFRHRHGTRGYRHALIAVGRVAERAVAAGRAHDLRVWPWVDYHDDDADRQLGLDGVDRSCLCLLGVGAGE